MEISETKFEEYANRLLEKLKKDPNYELKQEFGKLLMIHINDFTNTQRKRYDELILLLRK